eukprot:scaffold7464_cov136-Isochrysis_galbana.AAC.5
MAAALGVTNRVNLRGVQYQHRHSQHHLYGRRMRSDRRRFGRSPRARLSALRRWAPQDGLTQTTSDGVLAHSAKRQRQLCHALSVQPGHSHCTSCSSDESSSSASFGSGFARGCSGKGVGGSGSSKVGMSRGSTIVPATGGAISTACPCSPPATARESILPLPPQRPSRRFAPRVLRDRHHRSPGNRSASWPNGGGGPLAFGGA